MPSCVQVCGSWQGVRPGCMDSQTLAREVSSTCHSPRGPDGDSNGSSETVVSLPGMIESMLTLFRCSVCIGY